MQEFGFDIDKKLSFTYAVHIRRNVLLQIKLKSVQGQSKPETNEAPAGLINLDCPAKTTKCDMSYG